MVSYNVTKDGTLVCRAKIADTFFTRLKGLMFKSKLNEGEAVLITPCNSIHMFFMRFPLDVVFLNEKNEIVGLCQGIKPWRVSKVYWPAKYCIEMNVGSIEKYSMKLGDRLGFQNN